MIELPSLPPVLAASPNAQQELTLASECDPLPRPPLTLPPVHPAPVFE